MKYRATVRNPEYKGARLILSQSDDYDRLKEFVIDAMEKYLRDGTYVEIECNTCENVSFVRQKGY
jgi:hypothetical protein